MKKWRKEAVSVELLRKLNERYGVDFITASLMARRGIVEPEAVQFILEKDISYLHNPFLFVQMERFVDRVLEAREEGERVCVFGDRDVDGITSTVLLVEQLQSMGIQTLWRLPQGDEPYGLSIAWLDEAAKEGVTLAITVDCGISAVDEVEYAHSLGIDVLITDHHLASAEVPAATAVIDPKIEGCGYPFAHLAGCAVVAKCIWALRFGLTDFYKEHHILLHAYPGKETIIIEAVKLRNLVEQERIVEEIVPSVMELHHSRVLAFLDAQIPILSLDVSTVQHLLHKAFGKAVQIHIGELRGEFERYVPLVAGRSLFALKRMSKSVRYSPQNSELDALISLFRTYVLYKESSLSSEYEQILDLVALGSIGDLMPMVDENRILVKTGLKVIEKGSRQGLVALMRLQNLLGKKLSVTDISWHVSPVINSAGRLGEPQSAASLLLASDPIQGEERAIKLIQLNKERQRQGEEAWEILLRKSRKTRDEYDGKMVVVEDNKVSRGLTGIMASRLLRHYGLPSLVLAHTDDNRITGSMRSLPHFSVHDFLAQFNDLFLDYGGHKCAGGFSMEAHLLPQLKEQIANTVAVMEEQEQEEIVHIDAELPPEYLTPNLMEIVEVFEPYGESNPPLHFLIQGARVEQMQMLANTKKGASAHIKLQLAYGNYRWPALQWNGYDEISKVIDVQDEIDLVFKMDRNQWRNNETIQLSIVALQPHKTAIEKIMRLEEEPLLDKKG